MKPTGFILYEGPSVLDGAPIVAIATLSSSNVKTGNMVQTWILRADIHPLDAIKNSGDKSICGICPQRPAIDGACYVNVGQAPSGIWKAYVAGKYPIYNGLEHSKYIQGRALRLGAYGDPAAVPVKVWRPLVELAKGHTGYTHQLRHKNWQKGIGELCQISTGTEKSTLIANDRGFSTFRIKGPDQPLLPGEIECLADTKGITCMECLKCDGRGERVAITVHGSKKNRYKAA